MRKKCYTRQMYGCLSNSCRIWSILFIWNRYYLCTAYRKMTCSTVWQEYLVWQELDFEFSKAMMTCIWHVWCKVIRVRNNTFLKEFWVYLFFFSSSHSIMLWICALISWQNSKQMLPENSKNFGFALRSLITALHWFCHFPQPQIWISKVSVLTS